jgi:hypothetical protein
MIDCSMDRQTESMIVQYVVGKNRGLGVRLSMAFAVRRDIVFHQLGGAAVCSFLDTILPDLPQLLSLFAWYFSYSSHGRDGY